ncbi:DoxX family protein [Pedobacter nototheniae]|uniref:DoxX family protein n=1 Tax=Pedobacter nototheniae TaxID=2488994 RepID=UPI00292CDCD6|nr:DoxX family protein [Pedobacter nototheniae]
MQNTDNRASIYKIFLWIYAFFYILAGINHFIATDVYHQIMPGWIPAHTFLIYLSGVIEIILGISLLFPATRKQSAMLIILMLIAFLPAHFYMIEKAPFMLGTMFITKAIAWIRLPFQLLFIGWAWIYVKKDKK